jgi:ATP-dependent Clp protease protease subunit
MHRFLPLTLIATTLTVFAEPPILAHPIESKAEARASNAVEAKPAPAAKVAKATPKPTPTPKKSDEVSETERLTKESALISARAKRATAELHAELEQMKAEKGLLTEKLALEDLKRKQGSIKARRKFEMQQEKLTRAASLAKAQADKLSSELKARQVEWLLKTAKLEAEIKAIEAVSARASYADADPTYLQNPLTKDGILVISDRRISLNGPIAGSTADHVTTRINYFNNKNSKLPIFIVIDDSPGGSVMSGYRILKSMEGSKAPIHVVVKSFAASMAATILTLAEESYAYPNAVILHHQISSRITFANLNITEQKELHDESQKWWERLAGPVAKKMGVSTEDFIKQMYENSSSGDWTEFADEAKRLKWVNNVVTSIHETALLKNPDAKRATPSAPTRASHGLVEEIDENGRPVMYLPHSNPRDYYFLYNPDSYYRVR